MGLIWISALLVSLSISPKERKDLQFIHYSTEQGLSSSNATAIVQDKQGFIWISTEDGLNRFDSYNFETYRQKTGDATSLSYNAIITMFVDSRGGFWIGIDQGLNYYKSDFDSFINYYPDRDDYSSRANQISSIVEDKDHRLFVSVKYGKIFMFNAEDKTFPEVIELKTEIRSLFFDSDGFLWILTESIHII